MRKYLSFSLLLFIVSLLSAQTISLESIWLRYEYYPRSPSNFRWMNDDQFYSVLEAGKGIDRYQIVGKEKVDQVLDFAKLELGELTPDAIES